MERARRRPSLHSASRRWRPSTAPRRIRRAPRRSITQAARRRKPSSDLGVRLSTRRASSSRRPDGSILRRTARRQPDSRDRGSHSAAVSRCRIRRRPGHPRHRCRVTGSAPCSAAASRSPDPDSVDAERPVSDAAAPIPSSPTVGVRDSVRRVDIMLHDRNLAHPRRTGRKRGAWPPLGSKNAGVAHGVRRRGRRDRRGLDPRTHRPARRACAAGARAPDVLRPVAVPAVRRPLAGGRADAVLGAAPRLGGRRSGHPHPVRTDRSARVEAIRRRDRDRRPLGRAGELEQHRHPAVAVSARQRRLSGARDPAAAPGLHADRDGDPGCRHLRTLVALAQHPPHDHQSDRRRFAAGDSRVGERPRTSPCRPAARGAHRQRVRAHPADQLRDLAARAAGARRVRPPPRRHPGDDSEAPGDAGHRVGARAVRLRTVRT